jgi:modulator of FtsH protease HflK
MKRWLLLLAVAAALYALTGITLVAPDQQVVVQRFGAVLDTPGGPGLHVYLPWGLDRIHRLKPREIKSVSVGASVSAGTPVGTVPAQFLTGDRNLVNVRATIQYTVRNPVRYVLQSDDVAALIAAAAESSLARQLAATPVDHALTLGKRELGIVVAEHLQQQLDRYDTGVAVRSVDLAGVEPPADVADAFDEVVTALRLREQLVHEAQGTAHRLLAESQSESQQILDLAEAERDRTIRSAQGDSERFLRLSSEYDRAPALTVQRLYLESLAELLPRLRSKLLLDDGSSVDLSIFGPPLETNGKP